MVAECGSKRLLFVDILIVVAILFCSVMAIKAYFCDNQEITFSTSQDVTNNELEMVTWLIAYNFTANVLSAQNDIEISIIATPTKEYRELYPERLEAIDGLFVYFPEATPKNRTYEDGHMLFSAIQLTKDPLRKYYKGNTVIQYQDEGHKCVVVEEMELEKSIEPCENNISVVYISSADSKFQLETNRIILSLTWVFLAFTVISIRGFVEGFGYNLRLFSRTKKDEPTANTPE